MFVYSQLNAIVEATSIQNLQEMLDSEQNRANRLQAELDDAKNLLQGQKGIDFDAFVATIRDSKQFIQLRKTLRQKSEQLTDLRRRFNPEQATVSFC